jgi:hypothetical protein
MTANLLLRAAAVIALLFAAGHMMGGFDSWSPMGETPVLQAMKDFRFDVAGASRTYFRFYMGFGHIITILLFTQAIVLWLLSAIARQDARAARPMVLVFAASSLAAACVAWQFIFIVPALLSFAISVCLVTAVVKARKAPLSA